MGYSSQFPSSFCVLPRPCHVRLLIHKKSPSPLSLWWLARGKLFYLFFCLGNFSFVTTYENVFSGVRKFSLILRPPQHTSAPQRGSSTAVLLLASQLITSPLPTFILVLKIVSSSAHLLCRFYPKVLRNLIRSCLEINFIMFIVFGFFNILN